MEYTKDGLLIIKCRRIKGNILQMIDKCPLCKKKKHTHGACGPEFGEGNGSRVPHCDGLAEVEYYIVEVKE
jgi:hypothetical protein